MTAPDTPTLPALPEGAAALPERLPSPVADSHTHADVTAEHSGLSVDDSLALAGHVGVSHVVQVGCDVASSRWAVDLAERRPEVVAAVALHPNDAARTAPEDLDAQIDQIADLAASGPRVRAVGETGLDFYRTRDQAGRDAQRHSFRRHIEIARQLGLTLVIHDRDAHRAILEVLDEVSGPERVVMHCFSGDADFATECVARGFWLSFPGVVTFGSAQSLRDALAVVPDDQLLVETDAPFLTPVPARGRSNAPYLLPHTVRFVADQRGADLDGLCHRLLDNTIAAFGGDWRDA